MSASRKVKPILKKGPTTNKTRKHVIINTDLNEGYINIPEAITDSTKRQRWTTATDENLAREQVRNKRHGFKKARKEVPMLAAMAARRKYNINDVGDTPAQRARSEISLTDSRARSRRAHEELARASSASQGASSGSRKATGPIPHPKPTPSIRDERKPIPPPAPRAQGPISSVVSSVFGFFTGRKGGKRTRKNRKQKK